jgi:hypothetical protein
VTVVGYFYGVDLGPAVRARHHRVGKGRKCTCGLGATCPAVQAVADYLKAGGERSPDPPPGYFPVAPQSCPVCGAEAYYTAELSSRKRGAGCARGSETHYWQYQVNVLKGLRLQEPPGDRLLQLLGHQDRVRRPLQALTFLQGIFLSGAPRARRESLRHKVGLDLLPALHETYGTFHGASRKLLYSPGSR